MQSKLIKDTMETVKNILIEWTSITKIGFSLVLLTLGNIFKGNNYPGYISGATLFISAILLVYGLRSLYYELIIFNNKTNLKVRR